MYKYLNLFYRGLPKFIYFGDPFYYLFVLSYYVYFLLLFCAFVAFAFVAGISKILFIDLIGPSLRTR